MDKHIYKSHNKTLLLYHMVLPAKYRKKIFDDEVDKTLKDVDGSWIVPKEGFDLINEEEKIYVEMKNKHNTMNSSSSKYEGFNNFHV